MGVRWTRQPYQRLREGLDDYGYKEISVINPSRGLNVLVSDILINDKEGSNGSKNIEFAEGGVIRKRPGFTTVGTGLDNPTNGVGKFVSETTSYPLTADGGVVKKLASGTWSAVGGSVTVDVSADVSFTPLEAKTYVWDGVNGGAVFDGTNLTRPGTMPKAKFSVVYKGFHIASGVDGQPYRLYIAPVGETSRFTRGGAAPTDGSPDLTSAAGVPGATVFAGDTSPQAIDIDRNNAEEVTGLGFFQDVLIVFKEQSIYQMTFNDSGTPVVQRISSSYGCVSHGSIASVENDTYFLSENGVYVLGNEPNYFAAIRTNELSSRIKPIIQNIPATARSKATALYFDDRYWLSVPVNDESVNLLIVYDRRFYAWMVWDNIYANDLLVMRDDDGVNHFYFTDDNLPQMNEFTWGVYNDNGDAIEAIFRTRAFEGKLVDREKYWHVLHPIFRNIPGSIEISYITENGSQGQSVAVNNAILGGIGLDNVGLGTFGLSLLDTFSDSDFGFSSSGSGEMSSDTDSSNLVYEIPILLDSRTLKLQFSNANLNEGFTILGWKIFYQEKDIRRMDSAFVYR